MKSRENNYRLSSRMLCSIGLLSVVTFASDCPTPVAGSGGPHALNRTSASLPAAPGGGSEEFSGCHVIGDSPDSKLRCCTFDITPAKIRHWCDPRLAWHNPSDELGACTIGDSRIPGRRWYCPPMPVAAPTPAPIPAPSRNPIPTPSARPTPGRPPIVGGGGSATPPNPRPTPARPLPNGGSGGPTTPPISRIDRELPLVAGVYSRAHGGLHAGEALEESRAKFGPLSTFLWQKSLYASQVSPDPSGDSPGYDVETLFDDNGVRSGRLIPQISVDAVDPVEWQRLRIRDLADLRDKMCSSSSAEAQAMRKWARFFKSKGSLVHFRPFSEMNNPLDGHLHYHLLSQNAAQGRSRAVQLAGMWTCMRRIFREERADNVKFLMDVTGTLCRRPDNVTEYQPANVEWLSALGMIAPSDVDVIGIHPYCKPPSAPHPASVERMVAPWIREIDRTAHRGKPIIVAEMGVAAEYGDVVRARWICEAYQYARKHKHRVRSMVYFDQDTGNRNWRIDERRHPKAHQALREAIGYGLSGAPLESDYCAQTYR